jgi:hypothetical protein
LNEIPRTKPLILLKLQALSRRLTAIHPKKASVESEMARKAAGFRGEQSLDYYLNLLPHKKHLILPGLRIPFLSNFFQMDTLIITTAYSLIIEVKHISGTLIFDHEHYQLIRVIDGMEEIFQDPIQQVELQKLQLSQWFSRYIPSQIPIYTLVVVTNPNSKISTLTPDTKIHNSVIRSTAVTQKIQKLDSINEKEILSRKDVNKLSRHLTKQHTENDSDILEKFNISPEDLLTGVYCQKCLSYSMKRMYGGWVCPKCSFCSKDAHMTALVEYALLVCPTITNRELRNFLHIRSASTANNLLTSLNISSTGTTKGTVYDLSELIEQQRK